MHPGRYESTVVAQGVLTQAQEKHIVLRSTRTATGDLFLESLGIPSAVEAVAPATVSVEVEEIDRSKLAGLSRSSDVVAIAPAIPMKLIAPVRIKATAAPAAAGIAWG